jgi:hypothetical protein
VKEAYSICWRDEDGVTQSAEVRATDYSRHGAGFRYAKQLRSGLDIFLQKHGGPGAYATVRHCTPSDSEYVIGVELHKPTDDDTIPFSDHAIDYYEFLQISPKAEAETIQRIYRFLATRYHPDNPATGDTEKFVLLTRAFEVLSDPARRAAYDATRTAGDAQSGPAFESIDYMDGIDGEMNRRLAILSLLYAKCRACPQDPRVTLVDLEKRMQFPREYLDFAAWYLRSKKYITREDNGDFALTALGVDYVEANASSIPVLHKMLNSSCWGNGVRTEPRSQSTGRRSVELPPASQPTEVDSPSE